MRDHILGLDDLRPLSFTAFREGGPIPLYASAETASVLKQVQRLHVFAAGHVSEPGAGAGWSRWLSEIRFMVSSFIRIPVRHGEMAIAGFRFGRAAYLTDVSDIPEASFALLEGLDHLVLSALRYKPHPSHATVEQAAGLGAADRGGANVVDAYRARAGPRRDRPALQEG